jgi:pimeloyl-ACP methyl ester carboxylesterase
MTLEAVEIEASDGIVLRGEVDPRGSDWAVLVHDPGGDLDAWRPIFVAIAECGLTVLAFDLRGHGGSDGGVAPASTAGDTWAAVAYARRRGAERIYIGVMGSATRAALEAAAASSCSALFALGPVGEELDRVPPVARLALIASKDETQAAAGKELARSSGWTLVIQVPVADRGRDLLVGTWAPSIRDHVLTFLKHRRHMPAASCRPPAALRL